MPFPPVAKIHFTYDPGSGTLPDALTEAKTQVAGLGGITMTVVEFIDGSVVDIDAIPGLDAPLDMRLFRKGNGVWGWTFYNVHGQTSAENTTAPAAIRELLHFIETNGGPNLAGEILHYLTGDPT